MYLKYYADSDGRAKKRDCIPGGRYRLNNVKCFSIARWCSSHKQFREINPPRLLLGCCEMENSEMNIYNDKK